MENKKSLVALALVALVGIVGATYAYFTSSAKLTNEFVAGTYSTSVTEEFVSPDNWTPGTTTKKKVNVTNNGSVEVAVRATYTEKWTAKDGTVLSGTRNGEQVAQFSIGSDWEKATDGKYYYKGTLTSGQTSSDFISSVTFNPNFILEEGTDIECTTTKVDGKITSSCTSLESGYAGATYSLDITIETIQADQKWNYTVATIMAYEPGDEVTVAGETFNVIKDNGDTITMFAQFNLDSTYKQSETANRVVFSDSNGWEYTPAPKEIDIQTWSTNPKIYVNAYVSYLQVETGDSELTGTLITLSELKELGCTINDDYSSSHGLVCANSEHVKWLVNGQDWWTRSADSTDGAIIHVILSNGYLSNDYYKDVYDMGDGYYGIRPVITISKATLEKL